MPKQIFRIDRFEKGILSAYDSKDIPAGGLVTAKACDVGTIGIVKLLPKAEIESGDYSTGTLTDTDYKLIPGTGFFTFPSDFTRPASAAVAVERETEFYVYFYGPLFFLLDRVAGGIPVWDANSTSFNLANYSIDLGADAGTNAVVKPVFYYGDGALRVADGNYTNSNNDVGFKNRWFGHIKRSLFVDATASNTADKLVNHNRWHAEAQELIPPKLDSASNYHEQWITGRGSTVAGSVAFENTGANVDAPSDDDCMEIWVDSIANASSTWDLSAVYTFYLSFIYDGSQESPVTQLGTLTMGSSGESVFVGVTVQYASGADGESAEVPDNVWRINPRITGGRLYYSDPADGSGTKYLFLDIDLVKGCKKADELDYTVWGNTVPYREFECPAGIDGTAITATTKGFEFEDPPKALTYDILNGYGPEEVTSAKYKCATIFNNRTYIGNIQQVAKVTDAYDTFTPIYPDRIVRSPVNFEGRPQFDTFPATHKMDIAVNDGDDIIELEGYADRLLVFKKKSVYIVNVSQDGAEFVEKQLPYIGINHASQVVKFEKGIAWINPSGCYLYAGETDVVNLVEGKVYSGGVWLPSANWSGGTLSQRWSVDPSHTPAITYLFSKKQLWMSHSMNGDDNANDAWVYDFKTEGWTLASGAIGTFSRNRSNFMVDSSGVPRFVQYDPTSATEKLDLYSIKDLPAENNEFRLVTPDIVFGFPNVKKKVYKVYISFKTNKQDTNVKASYSTDASPESANLLQAGDNFVSNELNTTSEDFSTNIDAGSGVFDLSSDNSSGGTGLTKTSSNNTIRYKNSGAAKGYARYNLGTLEARTYNIRLYFKPGFGGTSRLENVKPFQAIFSVTTSTANPDTNNIFSKVVGQEGAYSFSFTATAVDHYFYVENQSAVSGDFIEVSDLSSTEEPDYYKAVLKPATSSQANNIYSFQLKLEAATPGSTNVPAGFEIGDISIVYRMKNIK